MKLWPAKKTLPAEPQRDLPLTLDQYAEILKFGGHMYPVLTGGTTDATKEEIARGFVGMVRGAYKQNGVIFACMLVRQLLFSEARFQFRQVRAGRPGDLFGTPALGPLEEPWPGGTTADLLTRMEQDASLAGNWFGARRAGGQIRRLRPDWVDIVLAAPNGKPFDVDTVVIGYLYTPGGRASGEDPVPYDVSEVAHYAPIPDPEAQFRGMSWLSPIIEEIVGDQAITSHKTTSFQKGAVLPLAMKFPVETVEALKKWKEAALAQHPSLESMALFLGAGADVSVIGSTFEQLQLKDTQGALETRIAAAAGVPPVIVGLSEGLDAATYSNYAQARRRFADGTMRPLWRNAAGSLANIVQVPAGAELWYDDRDISFLQEDMKDAAEIQGLKSRTIRQLTDAGFEPDSVVAAVEADDFSRLVHTGLFSVQLQPPGTKLLNKNGAEPDERARDILRELVEKT